MSKYKTHTLNPISFFFCWILSVDTRRAALVNALFSPLYLQEIHPHPIKTSVVCWFTLYIQYLCTEGQKVAALCSAVACKLSSVCSAFCFLMSLPQVTCSNRICICLAWPTKGNCKYYGSFLLFSIRGYYCVTYQSVAFSNLIGCSSC